MFKKVKKFFSISRLFKRNRGFSIHPKRDWAVLVVLFFLANIILISLLTLNYLKIVNDRELEPVENPQKIDSINEETVQKILDVYRKKKENYESLLNQTPKTSDPSN